MGTNFIAKMKTLWNTLGYKVTWIGSWIALFSLLNDAGTLDSLRTIQIGSITAWELVEIGPIAGYLIWNGSQRIWNVLNLWVEGKYDDCWQQTQELHQWYQILQAPEVKDIPTQQTFPEKRVFKIQQSLSGSGLETLKDLINLPSTTTYYNQLVKNAASKEITGHRILLTSIQGSENEMLPSNSSPSISNNAYIDPLVLESTQEIPILPAQPISASTFSKIEQTEIFHFGYLGLIPFILSAIVGMVIF